MEDSFNNKLDRLLEDAEIIRGSIQPKSVTPEMVGGALVGIVDALEAMPGVDHTPTDTELESIEPGIVADALRKTEQLLTPDEQYQVLKNLGFPTDEAIITKAKELFNVDLYTDVVYKTVLRLVYNAQTGLYDYQVNGSNVVTNLTVSDLQTAIISWPHMQGRSYNYCFANSPLRFAILSGDKDRAPKIIDDHARLFAGSKVEAVFVSGGGGNLSVLKSDTFEGASKLRLITGALNCLNIVPSFAGCASLETLNIKYLNGNISFADSPKLKLDSLQKLVTSARTNTKVITVHPDVYAKLTGDTTNAAAAALSEEELAQWTALIEQAAAKNIQFATA
ncbi:MAG: leucine-rich repeat domain-containing protein [Muribaculaceae bacterium]|nr:leucine-rich repeat domain-containing protein [Muribaculaceae bacterium]